MEVSSLRPDYAGFVFYPSSPRYAGGVNPEALSSVKDDTVRTGVFVDENPETVISVAEKFSLGALQFHGSETPDYCKNFTKMGYTVIKALPVTNETDISSASLYDGSCDYLLFDTGGPEKGGTGLSYNRDLLLSYNGAIPFFISGGITPGEIGELVTFRHPKFYGIDVNSRFEIMPGIKDVNKLRVMTNIVRKNRISDLFETKEAEKKILSIYFTAGYPGRNDTVSILEALEKSGVDMAEIGVPFSDPVADGKVIQQSSKRALENGMNFGLLFSQLEGIRDKISIPLIIMSYLNPILNRGYEKFCQDCRKCGIDGVIVPDLPLAEYLQHYKEINDRYGIKNILMITPETSEERVRLTDACSDSFIYMVSSAAVTGEQKSFDSSREEYFKRIKGMNLKNPLLVGFGISNRETYETACRYSDGVIVGSSFIRALSESSNPAEAAGKLLFNIK